MAICTGAALKLVARPADSPPMATLLQAKSVSPVASLVDGMLDLVPLPQAYVRIREIVDDPGASLRAISEVVTSDPALTGRVLRLANSAYLALASRVDSIDHAVRVLGLSQIHDIALATSAVGSLTRLRNDMFDIFDFWRMSVYTAVCARHLAIGCALPAPQRLFIAGLMHNIGNLILAHQLPQAWMECTLASRAQDRPYHELQRELLGFDYADVGAELLRQWNLPPALVQPVALHTRPIADVSGSDQPFAAAMHVAAVTARAAVWQSTDSEPVPDYDPTAIELTSTTEETIEELMRQVDTEVAEFIAILMPNG